MDLNTFTDYIENGKNIGFFYSKEEIAKLGVSLEELEALESVAAGTIPTENNSIQVNGSIIRDNFIIVRLDTQFDDTGVIGISVSKITYVSNKNYYIMRYAYGDNNNYIFISKTNPDIGPI